METKNTPPAPKKSRWKRIRNLSLAAIFGLLILGFAIRFYYPFGVGVKSGQLNYVVHKGIIFKTYEGKLIQSGFYSSGNGGIQSNEFVFSMTDRVLADSLMRMGGQTVELRYKEYFGRLPWRGHSKFIVNQIISVAQAPAYPQNVPPYLPENQP